MKATKRMGSVLAIVLSVSGWVQASVVEKPVVMPDAMVTVTVSDLHGLIDGVGTVAAQVNPMMNGMMLKNMLGMQLNDPGLTGIAPGKGLAVVAMDPTNIFAVVEVGEAQVPNYSALIAQLGVQSKYAGGVLVVAMDAAQLARGEALASAVKEKLLAKRSPTLRIAAQPSALVEKNQAQIDGLMQMMPMLMGMGMQQTPGMDAESVQGIARLLDAELRVALSLASQCESAEIVLAPKNGSLRIDETYSAKPGTRLATLLTAPKVNAANPKIQSGMLGDAAIALDFTLSNPDALTDFYCQELNALLQAMGLKNEAVTTFNETMKKWMGIYGGSFSESIGFGGENFLNLSYMMDVKDEAAALALYQSMEKDMAPLMSLYKSFGMPMTMVFKENVREYKGTKIHQIKMGITMPQEEMAAAQSMNMNLSNMVSEVAVSDGMMLYAMGEMKIETLIGHVKDAEYKPASLKARGVYPADGFYYCDVDIAKYMSGISLILPQDPDNPLPQLAAMLQGADPVTSAGFREDGAIMCSVNIPGSLLGKIGQTVMMMQMQQGGALQGMPMDEPMQ